MVIEENGAGEYSRTDDGGDDDGDDGADGVGGVDDAYGEQEDQPHDVNDEEDQIHNAFDEEADHAYCVVEVEEYKNMDVDNGVPYDGGKLVMAEVGVKEEVIQSLVDLWDADRLADTCCDIRMHEERTHFCSTSPGSIYSNHPSLKINMIMWVTKVSVLKNQEIYSVLRQTYTNLFFPHHFPSRNLMNHRMGSIFGPC